MNKIGFLYLLASLMYLTNLISTIITGGSKTTEIIAWSCLFTLVVCLAIGEFIKEKRRKNDNETY